jgi:HEPN domain-containing protein
VRLFDEFCNIRAQELISQNAYLLEHDDVKRHIWWTEDLRDTLRRIHRQGNSHTPEDFKDSEIILQDFIRRYSDANAAQPLSANKEDGSLVLS